MDHALIKELLSAFRDGELRGEACREVEAHLKGCSECRAVLDRWNAAAGIFFKSAPQPAASEFIVHRVMERIEAWERPSVKARANVYLRWLVPALGLAAFLLALWPALEPPVSVEERLLSDASGPVSWMLSDRSPTADEVLEFTMGRS